MYNLQRAFLLLEPAFQRRFFVLAIFPPVFIYFVVVASSIDKEVCLANCDSSKTNLMEYKKFFQIVKTIKMVTLQSIDRPFSRVKTRDLSLRYTEKMFGQDYDEEAIIKAATGTLLYIPITTNRGSCGSMNSQHVEIHRNNHLQTVQTALCWQKRHWTLWSNCIPVKSQCPSSTI